METKWRVFKRDVSKFCGVYKFVLLLREFGTLAEDILDCALDLYRVRHLKQQAFVFVHCWRLLKDIPRWADVVSIAATPQQPVRTPMRMPKWKTPPLLALSGGKVEVERETPTPGVKEVVEVAFPKQPSRPQGSKSPKDELRLPPGERAAANISKAQVLQDQAALSLFTMPNEQRLSDQLPEYLTLRREEEMSKL